MKTVRVAFIGTGLISHRHMRIYKRILEYSADLGFTVQIACACDIDSTRLKEWGEQYGIPEKDLYTDFREMLKRDDIDTVDVCVHNNLHTPISIEVMKRGFDCYCEKPAAASYHDAQMMIDCAKKLGRKFHVQISSIMTYQSRLAKQMIEDGQLGDVYFVNLEAVDHRWRPGLDLLAGQLKPSFSDNFYSRTFAGHGKSIDIGVYLISQILFVLGMPALKSVSGLARHGIPVDPRRVTNPDGYSVEDIADGFIRFENGIGFHFLAASAVNTDNYEKTYILGSKGGLDIINTDTGGGKFARKPGMEAMYTNPELRFHGNYMGKDTVIDLNCDENDMDELLADPHKWIYNDNQSMWLAYKLGMLDDNSRYNTPEIASKMLMITDGIFLSEQLGREVTAEEIIANSPALYVREQEIGGELYHFDTEF